VTLGALPPLITVAPPGPRSRALARRLRAAEAPGINTVPADPTAEAGIVWSEAAGANVVDVDGNRYVDLTSGFGAAAIGHRHPSVVVALRDQSDRLVHGLGDVSAHDLRPALAERLAQLAPFAAAQVFFAVTGAEAVEIALKTAFLATRRTEILAFTPSYHGLTFGALAATTRPAFREPFAAHLDSHVHHLPYGAETEQISALLRGGQFACILVEPIVGREGVLVPPAGWLQRLGIACHETGTLVIADEVFTGFGRTGAIFVSAAEGLVPDLLCCGKALGGGMPIAAVLGTRQLMAVWNTAGEALHTSTFVAHPLSCAAALAALEVLTDPAVLARVARIGRALFDRLSRWPTRFPTVKFVRGRGMLWGVELDSAAAAHTLATTARSRGVLVLAGGATGRVLQIVPPLTIAEPILDVALDVLEGALEPGSGSSASSGDAADLSSQLQ
jgi:acetylornithine/succinyldiaminopimelate/putrescine aminotransferase